MSTEVKTILTEIKGDLFSNAEGESLAHCVSADFHMGKGIALAFRTKFGKVKELLAQKKGVGDIAVLKSELNTFIYYLVTKQKYYGKPTYDSLTKSLISMKEHIKANKITKLSIPKIGCGLDKLDWDKVKNIINDVFKDIDVKITVYYI
jgi:O-acetyl-ADP-ribose deacetylase (regulator of RNase III)